MIHNKNNLSSVCVIGLGYVGLPTALLLASQGIKVSGYDTNHTLVQNLNKAHTDIDEAELINLLKDNIKSKKFQAFNEIKESDVYIICVPTPINENNKLPDLNYISQAVKDIKSVIKPNNLVILESTSPIGTTRELYINIKRHFENSINSADIKIYVSYCPERILPGKVIYELSTLDRVIGGINKESSKLASEIFCKITSGECFETTAEIAETVKLSENAFRDSNIAFANELHNICKKNEVNFKDVRFLANKHPRVNILQSGIGVGGHCIPIDPWFLIKDEEKSSNSIIRVSRQINDNQSKIAFQEIIEECIKIKITEIVLLGLTYKEDVCDFRESPSLKIAKQIYKEKEIKLFVQDPFLNTRAYTDLRLPYLQDEMLIKHNQRLYVFLIAHVNYKDLYYNLKIEKYNCLNLCNF